MNTIKMISIAVVAFVISISGLRAQDDMQTVFGNPDRQIDHGGYGAFTMGYTKIDGKDAMIMGGRAGWLIDHHFTIGFAGYGFFNNMNKKYADNTYQDRTLAGGYGGLFMEAIIAPNYPVHVTIPVLFGVGGATAQYGNIWDENYWKSYDYYYNSDAYLVFEPGVEVEINIMKFFRLALGATYRLTNGLNLYYDYYEGDTFVSEKVDPRALDGFNFNMSLKFGWF
jgi:hypothetical protein